MKKNAYYYLRSNSSVIKHSGSDSLDLLNRLTTNDLSNLNKLNPIRTLLTNNKGRIVDSLLILMRNDNDLYLLSDSNDQSKIINEIEKYTIIEDSILSDISKNISRLILYGKDIKSFLQKKLNLINDNYNICDINGYQITIIKDISKKVHWYEIILDKKNISDFVETLTSFDFIMATDKNFNSYCVQNMIPTYHREFGLHTNPIESGLVNLVNFEKGCYVGQEVIARLFNYKKTKRSLVLLKSNNHVMIGDKINHNSVMVGEITSVDNDDNNALALVKILYSKKGTKLKINDLDVIVTKSSE